MEYEVIFMPKLTYYNLDMVKQDKIIKAGIKEFSKYGYNQASVNRIIKMASISKGSFYQYFVNKEEYYWFINKQLLKNKITHYDELLIRYNGDVFMVEEHQFKEILELLEDEKYSGFIRNLYVHSFHNVKQKLFDMDEVNFTLMYQIYIEHKKEEYKVNDQEEFTAFYDMLRTLSTAAITGVIMNAYSKEFALTLYEKQINYIKNGMIHNCGKKNA
jgi:AcrR family transcriptional regulator